MDQSPEPSRLPQWEKELRLLFSLSHVFMPVMAPPAGVIDTSEAGSPAPDQADRRFLDPATLQIHPYVREKYLAEPITAWIIQQPAPFEVLTGKPGRWSRVYPAIFPAAQKFEAGGGLFWPYKSARHVIADVAEVIHGQLRDWRAQQESFERSVPEAAAIGLSRPLQAQLARLAGTRMDVPLIYGTLYFGGTALLQALSFYRELEERRHALRAMIRRDKRSVRSHLRFWQSRLRPDALERLEMETKEILDSLDLIRCPDDEQVRAYRRRLDIHRRGTKVKEQGFWTPLIGWAVRQLREARSEKDACEEVAKLLSRIWPCIHRWNFGEVKGRYYRTL